MRGDKMFINTHENFQFFLDQLIDSQDEIDSKLEKLKFHLLKEQDNYEQMLLHFFEAEELFADQYFYITYTYHDEIIDMTRCDEIVVSMLYSLEKGFYYEISVFNYHNSNEEYTLTLNRETAFLN